MADEEKRLKYIKAACFGVGIVIGLSIMRFAFDQSGALAGGIGGLFGAMIGLSLYGASLKFSG